LGAGKNLTRVDIAWYSSSNRAYKYKIEVSSDDVTYTTKIDKTGNTTYGDTSDSFAASGRYVRITVTGCTAGGAYASFYECKVYGY
jgi:FlaG/FlaF family flagellin (archaellin)